MSKFYKKVEIINICDWCVNCNCPCNEKTQECSDRNYCGQAFSNLQNLKLHIDEHWEESESE